MTRNRLKILGLTGEIAAGKSAVSSILRKNRGYILDADEISHSVILKSGPAYGEILSSIPGEYLTEKGEIDRKKLGEIVFTEPSYMRLLEGAVHKRVIERILAETKAQNNQCEHGFIVIDAALLIESGLNKHCDSVWVVEAPRSVRLKRLMERRGLTRKQAEARVSARTLRPVPGCVIIDNGGGLDGLNSRVLKNLTEFLEN